ncbi:MAG: hypothetical protein WCV93_01050 [Candidatus Shapirobacteria bacterium]
MFKPVLAQVQIGDTPLGSGHTISSSYPNLAVLVSIILKNALTVAGIVFLALLIFGGLTFIINAGSGDSKKTAQSSGAITNALIGFLVVFLAYFIIQIVEVITGLKILNPTI